MIILRGMGAQGGGSGGVTSTVFVGNGLTMNIQNQLTMKSNSNSVNMSIINLNLTMRIDDNLTADIG